MEYKAQISSYRQEFLDNKESMDGTGPLSKMDDIEKYIQFCKSGERKETTPENLVPATQFLYIRKSDNKLVEMIQIRHYFNHFLELYGEHIGYSVRKSERQKGYAKAMLKSIIPFCKEIGLDNILITCRENNIASEKTILSCGGVYESTVLEPTSNVKLKRFWLK